MLSQRRPISEESSHFVSTESLRVRLDWFNRMRWGAGAGILAGILIAGPWLGYPLHWRPLLATLGVLLGLNILYVVRNARPAPPDIRVEIRLVKLQMLGDLLVLTLLLNLTGGLENPFFTLYVIHVILASLLFKGREIFQIAWLAIALFSTEVLGEFWGVLPHHHLLGSSEMAFDLHYVLAALAAFWLVLVFSAYMASSIMKHNRAIKDELVERQSELIAADQAKTDFFRFVTHEIKSPVNTAQSAVETALELGGANLDPKVEDMLKRGVRRLEQASEMVGNLADLTRGGMVTPENMQVVNVTAVLQQVAENLTDLAARRGISIQLDLHHQPVAMTTNGAMLEKIATNLVSNAVRYNKEGGRVTVTLTDERESLLLTVADEGIGIAPEDQEKVFEEFFRTEAAQAVTHLGTGLGLSIVRKFVKGLGGSIVLESKPGEGSRFTVRLPRRPGSAGQQEG